MIDPLAVLAQECTRTETLLREASAADLLAPVPGCPGWSVSDLVAHLGGVHQWATAATTTPPDGRVITPADDGPGDGPTALADWFAEGAQRLQEALDTDPASACWTLAPPQAVAFWQRRQAHETTVHRWDLETALGREATVDADVAADGIDEVLTVMLPRQVRLGRLEATTAWVRLVAGERSWELATSQVRGGAPLATVSGPAPDLLLALWGRGSADLSPLAIDGDREALTAFLRGALTP